MSFAKGQKTLSCIDKIYSFCKKNGGVNIVGDWVESLFVVSEIITSKKEAIIDIKDYRLKKAGA